MMRKTKKILMALPVGIPSVLAVALIAYLSLASDPLGANELPLFSGADKVAHVLMYFCATVVFLLDYAKSRLPHHTRLNPEVAITAAAVLLGVVMEACQLVLTDGRSYSEADMVANAVGAVAALLLMHHYGFHKFRKEFYYKLRRRHHRHHRHAEAEATGDSDHTDDV